MSVQLNAEIAKLQGMQHKYSLLEFESTKSLWMHQSGDEVFSSPILEYFTTPSPPLRPTSIKRSLLNWLKQRWTGGLRLRANSELSGKDRLSSLNAWWLCEESWMCELKFTFFTSARSESCYCWRRSRSWRGYECSTSEKSTWWRRSWARRPRPLDLCLLRLLSSTFPFPDTTRSVDYWTLYL